MASEPCVVCGSRPTDRAHIKTKATGGGWEEMNIMQLCRRHHIEQHKQGWFIFSERNPMVFLELKRKGFEFVNEFGVERLRRIV